MHAAPCGETIAIAEGKYYIISHNLTIENVGLVPTFITRGTQTCIDITVSLNLPDNSLLVGK